MLLLLISPLTGDVANWRFPLVDVSPGSVPLPSVPVSPNVLTPIEFPTLPPIIPPNCPPIIPPTGPARPLPITEPSACPKPYPTTLTEGVACPIVADIFADWLGDNPKLGSLSDSPMSVPGSLPVGALNP